MDFLKHAFEKRKVNTNPAQHNIAKSSRVLSPITSQTRIQQSGAAVTNRMMTEKPKGQIKKVSRPYDNL
jgi:hypothetical protein